MSSENTPQTGGDNPARTNLFRGQDPTTPGADSGAGGGTPSVPDSLAGLGIPAAALGYGPIAGTGADKLRASAVAPLVALARGYESLTPANLKARLSQFGIHHSSKGATQIRAAVGNTDALLMPWFTAAETVAIAAGRAESPRSIQLRPDPDNVLSDRSGRKMKYINITGMPTCLGPHPATPPDWITDAPAMFVTEGMLKADSALSALLRATGIGDDILDILDPGETAASARDKLRAAMSSVPADQRVLVIGFYSVTTWRQNPEWFAFNLSGKTVYSAFDGDVATNANVWQQARAFTEFVSGRKGNPHLIDLGGVAPGPDKIGVDDFLSRYGDWDDLMAHARVGLPARPQVDVAYADGAWRMDPVRCVTEEFHVADPAVGRPAGWTTVLPFVAKVAAIKSVRAVSRDEADTGVLDRHDVGTRSSVEILISWTGPEGPASGLITGPALLLATPPDRWALTDGTSIPARVLEIPEFPPANRKFLAAMKALDADERHRVTQWSHMGWVPGADGTPTFLVGNQAITARGETGESTACAVTGSELPGAEDFGVVVPADDDDARAAVRDVLNHYLPTYRGDPADPMTQGAFHAQRYAAVVLAAALRPVVPYPCQTPVLFSGESGAGKALPLDALLPVPVSARFPTGWARNDQLGEGDAVYGPDGAPTRVRGFSEVTGEDCYRVSLDDGRSFVASGSHLLCVHPHAQRKKKPGNGDAARRRRIMETARAVADRAHGGDANTLAEIAVMLQIPSATLAKIVAEAAVPSQTMLRAVPALSRVELYPVAEVLYAVADHYDPDVARYTSMRVADVCAAIAAGQRDIALPRIGALDLPDADLPRDPYDLGVLLAAGLAGDRLDVRYARSGYRQRRTLLAGLYAAAKRSGSSGYVVEDFPEALARDVAQVAWSLGESACLLAGSRPGWLGVRVANPSTAPFHPPRERWRRQRGATITAVAPVGNLPARCLRVEHPTGMFLTDEFVPTHNSWASAAIMWFWQPRGGTWHPQRLPGSGQDTYAASEHAITRVPIWVMDDLSPSGTDPIAQRRAAGTVNDLIRAVHNGAAKRRSNQHLTAAVTSPPRALLVLSAESPPEGDSSVMNRTLHVPVARPFLNKSTVPTTATEEMAAQRNSAAKMTGYAILLIARMAERMGWEEMIRWWRVRQSERVGDARETLGESADATRQARSVADLALGIDVLHLIVEELGIDEWGEMSYWCIPALFELSASGYQDTKDSVIGRRAIAALRSLLATKRVYVSMPGQPGPPMSATDPEFGRTATSVNEALGWPSGPPMDRPNGPQVGVLVRRNPGSPWVVLIDPISAFAELERLHEIPTGLSRRSVWSSVWASGLANTTWRRKPAHATVRVRVEGQTIEGVPVPLSTFVDGLPPAGPPPSLPANTAKGAS